MAEVMENVTQGIDDMDSVELVRTLTFDDKVIKKIAGYAVGEISGVLAMGGSLLSGLTDMLKSADDPTKGISVEVGKKQVAVDIKVICEYGVNIPAIFDTIVEKLSTAIKEMTGLDMIEINVNVADVLTRDEFERKRKPDSKATEFPLLESSVQDE